MKKLLTIGVSVLALSIAGSPAYADNHGPKGEKRGAMFEKHDVNGDGMVSEDEFISHAKARFQEMDGNGDGAISKEEAKSHRDQMKVKWKEKREERMEKRQELKEKRENSAEALSE